MRDRHRAEVRELIATDPSLRTKPPAINVDARTLSAREWKDALDLATGHVRGGKKFETMARDPLPRQAYDVSELNARRRGETNVSSTPAARPMDISDYNAQRRGER
jgi:hypothetical protein